MKARIARLERENKAQKQRIDKLTDSLNRAHNKISGLRLLVTKDKERREWH